MFNNIQFKLKRVFFALASLCLFSSVIAAEKKDGVIHLSQEEFMIKVHRDSEVIILDVRTPREFADGHIEGAINLSHSTLVKNVQLLKPYQNKELILYCHTGVRAKIVTDYLREIKFIEEGKLFHLKGDIRAWKSKGLPFVK